MRGVSDVTIARARSSAPSRARARHHARDVRRRRARDGAVRRFRVPNAPDEPAIATEDVPLAVRSLAWSARLGAIADLALAGGTFVVDACAGHALVGLGACERGARCVAVDRSPAECARARLNVELASAVVGTDVASRVEVREGDGLAALRDELATSVDVVVVAGVGANTMAKVLESGGLGLNGTARVRRLVLNPPAKDGASVRRWCAENGWVKFRDERLIVENETMHLIMAVERDEEDRARTVALSITDEIIGPVLGKTSARESPLLKLYISKRLEWLREVRRQASQNATRLARRGESKSDADRASLESLEEKISGFNEMEVALLAAIGVDAEEQRRNAREQLTEQISRGFDGFDLVPGKIAYKTVDPDESDGRLGYCRSFLSEDEARELMETLVASPPVAWAQRSIVVWQPQENTTKEVVQPRLVSWAGDIPYKYSGQTLHPVPVPDVLRRLQDKVERLTGETFNHILLNRYRDGSDSMALHADDEPELGRNACIAAVSIGHVRRFDVQLKSKAKKKTSIFLENGSLMVMDRSLQHTHYHGVPKNQSPFVEGERINITFRLLRGPPGWRERDEVLSSGS